MLWRPEAKNMFFANWIAIAFFVGVINFQLLSGVLFGLVGIVGILIAVPYFFYFKELQESKLWQWRLIRMIAGGMFVLIEYIIGMVV